MSASSDKASWRDVLEFWFGAANARDFGRPRQVWFSRTPDFDQAIGERFAALHRRAAADGLRDWTGAAEPMLALLIVLDQFSRNLYRDDARAFACDAQALALARQAVAAGFDRALAPVQRWFVYLPYEHAEDVQAQREGVALMAALPAEPFAASALDYARRHLAVIERFGRFPHRNAALGRASTAAEIEFLKQPGSRF